MKLKVADLVGQLESRGLDSKGTKPTLVDRLQEAMDGDDSNEGMAEADAPLDALKKKILEQTDSPSVSRPGTPTRKSRRVSGNFAEERPETPTRKSRRLSGNFDAAEERPETPTTKSRRLSGSVAEDRPMTPTRKSRRLSGGFEQTEDRPMTPTRKSRRLSGAGEDEKPDIVKSLLLEDQLAGLGSPSRRTSATARNKRISQLGGAAITTIPEVPEKEVIVEAPIIEEKEPEVDIPEKKEPETKAHEKEVVAVVIKPAVESNFTALKEKEIKDMPEKEEKLISSKKPAAVADKENHPMVKVLDRIIVAKNIPRQKPKSGKFWKEGRQQFRQIKRDKGKKFTFEQRMKNKEEKMKNKELADLLLNRKALKKEEMRKKIAETKAKKLENERKSEQFQVIKNPAKIKRMKKKQLRQLEKRDLVTV